MKQKIMKLLGIIITATVIIILIMTWGTASAINPNSKKIAELSYNINELETHKTICLDNLTYKESVANEKGETSYCDMYNGIISQYKEELNKLKERDTEETQTSEREPGKLNEEGTAQEMPNIQATTEHEKFKELAQIYGLNASTIRQIENHYGIKEGVILCITVAETSGGKKGYGKSNPGNVGNNDRGDRVQFALLETGLEKIGQTLNNQYLGKIQTLGCLSNGGSCQSRDNHKHRYATSNGNWERNMVACLSTIYGPINASEFNIRR